MVWREGIDICDEWWYDFESFYEWALAHGYSNDLTIDRINNDGDYTPNNCRWVSMQEQSRNKRHITYKYGRDEFGRFRRKDA